MVLGELQKPSYDEWMYWSQVVIDRLTTIVHVYNKPPHADVFMPQNERQLKVSMTVDILRKLHTITEENDIKSSGSARSDVEEGIIAEIQPMFRDVLQRLPAWSYDMQLLLKSPWFDKCAGKLANDLFKGPDGRETEGIGGGMPENGRLPETIYNLIEREQMGEVRASSQEKQRNKDTVLRRVDLAKQWARQNGSFLRTAGRVD